MNTKDGWEARSLQERRKSLLALVNGEITEPDIFKYLNLVRASGRWGVYASTGPHFMHAIFGRDSLTVAEDLLEYQPTLCHDILVTLARLQGHKYDNRSEEEPGKIPHEFRPRFFDGVEVPEHSLGILYALQRVWGGEGTEQMLYYGTADATPLFIRTLGKYIKRYGREILNEPFLCQDGQTHTMAHCLRQALAWLIYKLESSDWGLLEYRRLNPHGLVNQAWKDSDTSYLLRDGSLPNFEHGVAAIELQGYTYDALVISTEILAENQEQKKYWQSLAYRVQKNTLDWFWMDDVNFFAQALDHGADGRSRRQINTLTSNGPLLFDSQLLHKTSGAPLRQYVENTVRMICSSEFLTDAGLRSRASQHNNLTKFIDYHGTYTVWPRESHAIARGLRMLGYPHIATQLENRILRSITIAGQFYEFFYVEMDGLVCYDRDRAMEHLHIESPSAPPPVPETGQAWTISAVIDIVVSRLKSPKETEAPSQFEEEIMHSTTQFTNPFSLDDVVKL